MSEYTPKTNPLILSMLLIVGLFFASTAWAGPSQSHDFDVNSDGQITFEEVMKTLERSARSMFNRMDRNKDGVLSNDDFNDVREGVQKLEEWLDHLLKPFMLDEQEAESLEL